MVHLPFYLCTNFQYIIGYFYIFIFYSFQKIVILNFLFDTSFKRKLQFFICLEMPVNKTQYRGPVGIFNSLNFAFRPKFTNFIGNTCWGTNRMYFKLYLTIWNTCWSTSHVYFKLYFPIFPMNLVLFLVFAFAVLSPRCSFYITSRNTTTYTSILLIIVALLSDYHWFTCNLLLLCGDVELNLGPDLNTAKHFKFSLES